MVKSAYSPIKHLAHALFFKHDENLHYFAMVTGYTAYFDAAGQRGQGYMLTVGGYIASVNRWDCFNEHWGKILEKQSIEQFHMADFMHSERSEGKWKKNDGSAENFLMKLARAIGKAAEHMPLATIYLDDWEKLNKKYQLKETGHTPFALAGAGFIELAYMWSDKKGIPRKQIEFIFEDGDLDKGHLMAIAKKVYGINLIPRDKSFRPLQACDLIAWDAQNAEKIFMKSVNKEEFELPARVQQMLQQIDHEAIVYYLSDLDKFCEAREIPYR